jgi:hypothetical protein
VKPEGTVIDHLKALSCITDELLKAVGHSEDARRAMCDAEVRRWKLVNFTPFPKNYLYAGSFRVYKGIYDHSLLRLPKPCRFGLCCKDHCEVRKIVRSILLCRNLKEI